MDTDRLIRFTVAGWGLLLSWIFHLWILGSPNVATLQHVANPALVIGLMSGPFLGFMISSAARSILRYWRGGSLALSVITSSEELSRFVKALTKLMPEMSSELNKIDREMPCEFRTCSTPWGWSKRRRFIRYAKDFEPYFDFLHHSKAPESLTKFNTRRWTLYWMSLNSSWAILVGGVFALLTADDFYHRDYQVTHWLMEGLIGCAVFALSWRIGDPRDEINKMARLWLYSEAKKSDEQGGNSP